MISGSSPFAGCTADNVGTQDGTNYLHSEVEPYLTTHPNDASQLAVTFQQDRWSGSGSRGVVSAASFDGGLTWQRTVVPGLTKCSGGSHDRASNPWLAFGPDGTLYHSAIAFNHEPTSSNVLVNRSNDGGLTWSSPSSITGDSGLNDKPSITADPFQSGYAYVVWQRLSTYFSRTTDHGESWSSASQISSKQLMGAHILARHVNRGLILLGGTLVGGGNRNSAVVALRSSNSGTSWSSETEVSKITLAEVTDPDTRRKVRTSGTYSIPTVAVDNSLASPGYGNLYAAWEDGRFAAKGKTRFSSIALSVSTNGGVSWSTPIKVNQTPSQISAGNQQAFDPSISVSGDGTVSVSYYDLRNNTSEVSTLWTDRWISHCHPTNATTCAGSSSWGSNGEGRLTTTSFDLTRAPDARGLFLGDYEGLSDAGDAVGGAFAITHGQDPASILFRRMR